MAKVTIKKANVIDISWLKNARAGFCRNDPSDITSIQAVDVILKAAAMRRNFVPVKIKLKYIYIYFLDKLIFLLNILFRLGDLFSPRYRNTVKIWVKVLSFAWATLLPQ